MESLTDWLKFVALWVSHFPLFQDLSADNVMFIGRRSAHSYHAAAQSCPPWSPLWASCLKLNFGGSADGNPWHAGIEGIIPDCHSRLLY